MRRLKTERAALKISCETIKRDPQKYLSVVGKSYLMGILTFTEKSLVPKDTIDEYNDYASIRNDYKKEKMMPLLDPGKFGKILIPHIRPNQGVRVAYAYGRQIDDFVDGHTQLPPGFASIEELLDDLLYSLSGGKLDSDKENLDIVYLQKAVCAGFLKKGVDIKPDLIDFLLGMKTEYQRRTGKQILPYEELVTLHYQSFRGPHQIYLTALNSKYSAKDIHELPQILGFIYGLKDLASDLSDNVCNIPQEICDQIPYRLGDPLETLCDSDIFWSWIDSVLRAQKQNYETLVQKIDSMDVGVKIICNSLLPEIYQFFDRYTKEKYRDYLLGDRKTKIEQVIIPEKQKIVDLLKLGITKVAGEIIVRWYMMKSPISMSTAIQCSDEMCEKYEKELGIISEEQKRYYEKSKNLTLMYLGFLPKNKTNQQSIQGAVLAGFLSCAYDVCSDRGRDESYKEKFKSILDENLSHELAELSYELFMKDISHQLNKDGLDRGSVTMYLISRVLDISQDEFQKMYGVDTNTMGRYLQMVDDILDREEDIGTGKLNFLQYSELGQEYLEDFIGFFSKKKYFGDTLLQFVVNRSLNQAKKLYKQHQK